MQAARWYRQEARFHAEEAAELRWAIPRALALVAAFVLAAALSGCGGSSTPGPAATTDQCPAVAGLVRTAPASASDPASSDSVLAWLGRLDKVRDLAKASGDDVLAADLDYGGALVALSSFPPQAAVGAAQRDCAAAGAPQSAPAVVAPVRAWLQANPVPARTGMITGIVTQAASESTTMAADGSCLLPSHGSEVARVGPCIAWTVTLTTATGTQHASCGNVADEAACTVIDPAGDGSTYLPGIGDELQVPARGQVSRLADLAIISAPGWAVS